MKNKKWTVLMYLDGNNEMAPEMYDTLEKINNIEENDKNIICEIGQAPFQVINSIRPYSMEEHKCSWTGVRRYLFKNNGQKLIEDLGNINLADYKNLYRFLEWGIKKYPAKRYMVVISGHGFLVMTLSDLCHEMPYTMGLFEMCTAINNVYKFLKVKIDILLLDICNMNNIEFIYELGKNKENTVENIITYIDSGPLEGIEYKEVLLLLDQSDTKEIIKNIVRSLDFELVAVEVNHNKLEKIKSLSSKLGYEYIKLKEKKCEEDLIAYKDYLRKMTVNTMKLVIAYKFSTNKRSLINIMHPEMYNIKKIDYFIGFYSKLAFTKNNYWFNVVSNRTTSDKLNNLEAKLTQEILTKENLNIIADIFD